MYFYATTSGTGKIARTMMVGYARLLEEGAGAYVGKWTNGSGATCIDAVKAIDDGMDDAGIRGVLAEHRQQTAAKLVGEGGKDNNITGAKMTIIDAED